MPVKVAIVSAAHVHAPSFAGCFQANEGAQLVGIWDDDLGRGRAFASKFGIPFVADLAALLAECDAVAICSENLKHADHIDAAVRAGCRILCEKPIAGSQAEWDRIAEVARGTHFMTAFPCAFSPTFQGLQAKVRSGDIGKVLAVNATNQGSCPGGWFTNPVLSGGGAMIDHVVHVADLLRRLLAEDPATVQAQTGTNLFGQEWDDTAMVTVGFPSGVFATIDSSWSKPPSYKTWGNVKLTVVGEKGVVEADLFAQGVDRYTNDPSRHGLIGTGSNLDQAMVDEFVRSIEENRLPSVTLEDGLWASRVALAGYRSSEGGGAVVPA